MGSGLKCPYCGFEGEFLKIKQWRMRWYTVEMLECPKCHGRVNHYHGTTPTGKKSDFYFRIGRRKQ
ncbi:hypothetical protein IMZ38_00750 [Thermosphaera chiliense]|uniref:Uncharacterized protein n=1 Tax=Thermosphaera chiliense TaxID=3402707 RepID=A0A7M1UU91_9CREN|nr:hypothetical protein [Thermosphaera aggregans]QOR94514.1 hypothetical protein IMZ38_00750 [Thermosphaera aggregans]